MPHLTAEGPVTEPGGPSAVIQGL